MISRRYAGQVVSRASLAAARRASMFDLLGEYFGGLSVGQFGNDLDEKDWVILLTERDTGKLAGFTTLMRFTCPSAPACVALFSGDTIVSRAAWNETVLARAWARLAFAVAAREAGVPVYWFLICSGFRTYRFLPVFFREFHPRFDETAPPGIRQLSECLAQAKFGDQYDPRTGVVKPARPAVLRPELAGCAPRSDPHVSYFLSVNPGHSAGHELVCLARLSPGNLTAAGRRMSGLS